MAAAAGPAGPLQVGDLLAGRYLLVDLIADDGPAVLWRARDEVLARAVAVKVLATPTKRDRDEAEPFLEAAVRTCSVNHPGLARVYDATLEHRPGRGNDVAYVISEWLDAEPLDAHLLSTGALAPLDATDVVRQAADALEAAQAGGLLHGRLHPRNVLITPGGRVRITDAAVAAALHGHPVSEVTREGIRSDTSDLAGILYALLTARWPESIDLPGGDLPAAPLHDGQLLSARQVRAGVPRSLDVVVTRGLSPARGSGQPPIPTPAALADAADESVIEARVAASRTPARPSTPSWVHRWWRPAVAAAAVLVSAAAGWLIGLSVGDLERDPNAVDAIVSPTAGASPGSPPAASIPLARLAIRDFDPAGDRQENPDQIRNAVDGFPNTAWSTSRYRTERFGGLKSGVGLLLDLGSVRSVKDVEVGFTAPGAKVELRVADTAPGTAEQARLVAAALDGKLVAALAPSAPVRARYLLVWITSLPKDGDGFRVGISELRVT